MNISDQKTHVEYLKSQIEHCIIGTQKDSLKVSKPKEVIVDICEQMSSKKQVKKKNQTMEETSATVEYQPEVKKKIWKDKLSSLDVNTLIMKLSLIMDQALTSKEKVLTPFWTPQSKEISTKLWLPTEIDCVDSVLTSSKESLPKAVKGKSWFSIKKKHPHKKNSLATSFQSSLFSLPDCMDLGVTQSNAKSDNKPVKTIKIRLFPTEKEKEQLQMMMDQFRWYYNSILTIVYNHYGYDKITDKSKYSNYTVRDLMRKYDYIEESDDVFTFKEFVFNEERNEIPIPEWWTGKVHSRLPRGAIGKFVSSLNSAISNYKNGNISKFKMNFMSKKNPTTYMNFEDKSFPSFIRKIKSKYWYTTKNGKRKSMSFSDIDAKERGLEIIYEKETDRYFLHYPIDRDWFPSDDRRNDSQVKYVTKGDRLISLDPGIRKFLVGYDPSGYSIFIGEGASLELTKLLLEIDKHDNTYLLWKKVKNLVSELHWKTISFLVENYDTIILPDFRVSQMIRSRKLSRMTKRLMCMFSFHSFKEKLKYKCDAYSKKLIIVDESYTSCTCGVCGTINDTKGKEIFSCISCGLKMDRDVGGSRNILIKNSTLR
jgi:IS605 OrfB family transposase